MPPLPHQMQQDGISTPHRLSTYASSPQLHTSLSASQNHSRYLSRSSYIPPPNQTHFPTQLGAQPPFEVGQPRFSIALQSHPSEEASRETRRLGVASATTKSIARSTPYSILTGANVESVEPERERPRMQRSKTQSLPKLATYYEDEPVPAPIPTMELEDKIQRSMSRYRRKTQRRLAPDSPPRDSHDSPAPSIPRIERRRTTQTSCDAGNTGDQQNVKMMLTESNSRQCRGHDELQMEIVPGAIMLQTGYETEQRAVRVAESQELTGTAHHSSQSRYGRFRAQTQANDSSHLQYPPTLLSRQSQYESNRALVPHTQHDIREAVRRIQKQPALPSMYRPDNTTTAQLRLPHDTVPKSIVLGRRVSDVKRQGIDRYRGSNQHAQQAQNEVQLMLDAEALRQRKMQEKIRADNEKLEKAQEAERALAAAKKKEDEERRSREILEAQQAAEARIKAKKEEKIAAALAKKEASVRSRSSKPALIRKESKEERTVRYQDRSMSQLDGRPNNQTQNAPAVPVLPSHQQAESHAKSSFTFFKRKKTTASSARARIERAEKEEEPTMSRFGVTPGIDAPISAVNSGERRVLIECSKSSMFLPVTPTTTPVDLITSASRSLNEVIDIKASVLLETFGKVGVQRPLRRYEHIRDVMNSWDDDRQNSLTITQSARGGNDTDLDASTVSTEQPAAFSCLLHYSNKPGKWDRRYITLRTDGQVVWSKYQGHKDSHNICHMTDFDIYSPKRQQLTKKIRPPKKLCFAIKSQQKSNMFMSLQSFVHFFSTNDTGLAATFYAAIQGWRSWYLVNVLGKGRKTNSLDETDPNKRHSHYQPGSAKPLLELDFLTSSDRDRGLAAHACKTSRADPPGFPAWLTSNPNLIIDVRDAQRPGTSSSRKTDKSDDAVFAPNGLLGRSYSTRQKPQAVAEEPFTGGLLAKVDGRASTERPATGGRQIPRPLGGGSAGKVESPMGSPGLTNSSGSGSRGNGIAMNRVKPLIELKEERLFKEGTLLGRIERG